MTNVKICDIVEVDSAKGKTKMQFQIQKSAQANQSFIEQSEQLESLDHESLVDDFRLEKEVPQRHSVFFSSLFRKSPRPLLWPY
ncbi:hypothetical protein A3I42_02385 [Candidatus Uhrbacteria bacterium RIFCSPLOWO2_02_FULL_49_11]|uniref:Uncharacterized protein n=1 Tax=Candidatus Uhrbacteria bacterium RIFCSPLOWO2_02_FULL_49_11 TaxID=1802409 RepID=A0A1F7VDQ9_9BACT|nr:MAG: hypothetical protein A3I42_02385 [Candidatus Uhrbacteria bacterium RIFCSPLOWO2_02_FULL_49_11]